MTESNLTYRFHPVPKHRFFWVEFFGEFDLDKLALAYGEFISHPDYFEGIDELLDFSGASVKELTVEAIARIRAFTEARPEQHHNRSVLVVNPGLEFQLAKTLGTVLEKTVPVDRHVCYSVREAIEWLRPEQATEIIASLMPGET